jgi:hypothetical protein
MHHSIILFAVLSLLLREFVLFISFDEQRYPMHSVDGHISASWFFTIFTNAA